MCILYPSIGLFKAILDKALDGFQRAASARLEEGMSETPHHLEPSCSCSDNNDEWVFKVLQ